MNDIRVGISGWRYAPWRGSFYPKNLGQKNELKFASRCVNTIEINGSFYALQTPERYAQWHADTPDDFIFSVKGPRYVTHIQRLRDVEIPIANFFASGPMVLEEKLGPILWQFPPSFTFSPAQFRHFLTLLPKDTTTAFEVAKNSSESFNVEEHPKPSQRPLRYCVEIRNESFREPEFVELLREFNVALVVADTAGRWPQMEDITSDFVYMRLHGDAELYKSGYSEEALQRWYQRMKSWSQGEQPAGAKLCAPTQTSHRQRDIFCYFDNTDKLWAPYDARKILEKFGRAGNLQETPGKPSKNFSKNKAENNLNLF